MSNPPKGLWKCPECGAFVYDYRRTCSDCGYSKNQTHSQSSLYSKPTSNGTTQTTGIVERTLNSDEGGWLSGFFTIMAWIIWIGGLIAAVLLGRTEQSSRYSGTYSEYNFALIIGIYAGFVFSGALSMAIGRVLRYLDIISCNSTRLKITIEHPSKE